MAVFIGSQLHLYYFFRSIALTVRRTLTHCNALHCTACHNEEELSGARGESNRGDVEERTGAKCYVETGSDLVGKVHTFSVHELAPDGSWQVAKRKRIVSTSHAWAGPEQGH